VRAYVSVCRSLKLTHAYIHTPEVRIINIFHVTQPCADLCGCDTPNREVRVRAEEANAHVEGLLVLEADLSRERHTHAETGETHRHTDRGRGQGEAHTHTNAQQQQMEGGENTDTETHEIQRVIHIPQACVHRRARCWRCGVSK